MICGATIEAMVHTPQDPDAPELMFVTDVMGQRPVFFGFDRTDEQTTHVVLCCGACVDLVGGDDA